MVMKRRLFLLLTLALLDTTACSWPAAPEATPQAQPGLAAAATRTTADPVKQDLDKLQGTWQVESTVWNGSREPEAAQNVRFIVQGDQLICVDKDGNRMEADRILLMPAQNPKGIDYWSKGQGQAAPGIYSLDGDTFIWCSAGGKTRIRPTTFSSEPGSRQSLMVLRRRKS
jgi:uncharacterized protein (TIGR03067 family)